ncbi:hypothetical protein HY025_05585 [Candidatus Daviesbacteria bacterium]|nr:hypothetical protein [Candidatus Daviesbacteria bacterium]
MLAQILVHKNSKIREQAVLKLLTTQDFSLNHPDLLYFEDAEKLGVEETKKIKLHFSLKPYSAKARAVALVSAHNFTLPAQNSLLKTLEELPEQALFYLGVDNLDSLLPTIISRCQIEILNNQPEQTQDFSSEIEQLLEMNIEDRFKFIEKLEQKQEFLAGLVVFYRNKLHSSPNLVNLVKQLLQAEQWSKANVNIRTILEYLMLNLPKSA